MKKGLSLALALILVFSLVACNKAKSKKSNVAKEVKQEQSVAKKESKGETKGEIKKETKGEAKKEMTKVTEGKLKKISEADKDGNKEALFENAKGQEFIVLISKNTKVVELKVGNTYKITHADMATNSLPPKYPQVQKIEAK